MMPAPVRSLDSERELAMAWALLAARRYSRVELRRVVVLRPVILYPAARLPG